MNILWMRNLVEWGDKIMELEGTEELILSRYRFYCQQLYHEDSWLLFIDEEIALYSYSQLH